LLTEHRLDGRFADMDSGKSCTKNLIN